MTKRKKFLLILLIIIILLAVSGVAYAYFVLNSVISSPIETEKLGINENLDNTVINIAFFGIDGRDDVEVEGDRTDVIMIGTLDTKTNKVKLTSVMRDTYTKICINSKSVTANINAGDQDGIEWNLEETILEGEEEDPNQPENSEYQIETETQEGVEQEEHEMPMERVVVDYENTREVAQYDKINAAFNEAGVESSILTLNTNFDLNIEDYVTVDFNCLMDAVDALGGIELDIANEDILYWTNEYLKDSNVFGNRHDPDLTHTGVQTLTGAQTLAFARNRYTDSDYGRSQRQREVVQAIFDKVKKMDAVTALNLVNKIYPYIQTSLSLSEITSYATKILSTSDLTFEDYRIPTNKYGTAGFINGVWYLFPDTLIDNNFKLHEFIYGNQDYTPSNTVKQISQVIDDALATEAYDITYEVGGKEEEKVDEQTIETDSEGETTESATTEENLE